MSANGSIRSPFLGLVPYGEEDRHLFFGRDDEIETAITNLIAARLTVLYGASGVGKSSLLHAGVVPQLRDRAKAEAEANEGRPDFIVVIFNAWRDDPVGGLIACIHAAAAPYVRDAQTGVRENAAPGPTLIETIRDCSARTGATFLIILDQFEEYLLYHAYESGEHAFAVQFPRAVTAAGLPANFLVAVREDLLALLDRFRTQIPGLFANLLRVEHLDCAAGRQAILNPVRWYNDRQPEDRQVTVEPALVDAVLEQVQIGQVGFGDRGRGAVPGGPALRAAPAGDQMRIEAPFLQLVMIRLWEQETSQGSRRLRLGTLQELGGAAQIVAKHLDNVMGSLTHDERGRATKMLVYLITGEGRKLAKTAGELSQDTDIPEVQLRPLLDRLVDLRILRGLEGPPGRPEQAQYEIYHDLMAPGVLAWRKSYLAQQSRNRWRLIIGISAAVILILAALAIAVLWGSQQAKLKDQEAELRGRAEDALQGAVPIAADHSPLTSDLKFTVRRSAQPHKIGNRDYYTYTVSLVFGSLPPAEEQALESITYVLPHTFNKVSWLTGQENGFRAVIDSWLPCAPGGPARFPIRVMIVYQGRPDQPQFAKFDLCESANQP